MWELGVLEWFDSLHGSMLDPVMVGITYSATSGLIWFVLGFLMTCSGRWRGCGASIVISVALAYIVVDIILKPRVCRERPFMVEDFELLIPAPDTWSFPSGHTASAFAGATALLLHSRRPGLIALAYAVLVGISRMYLCVHWPTDVIAGAAIGVLVAVLVVWFAYRYVPWFRDLGRECQGSDPESAFDQPEDAPVQYNRETQRAMEEGHRLASADGRRRFDSVDELFRDLESRSPYPAGFTPRRSCTAP